jgi:hypothetical protein
MNEFGGKLAKVSGIFGDCLPAPYPPMMSLKRNNAQLVEFWPQVFI